MPNVGLTGNVGAAMRRMRVIVLAWPLLAGCANVRPPQSAPPTADAALGRMHATFACANALQGSAKIDHFGHFGRVRGDLLLFAARAARIRMDVISPFGATLATLTSDGREFALADLRDRTFFTGPASACNIARLTTVTVPGHVLVDLVRGEAPVLKHEGTATTIAWDPHGWWTLGIPSTRGAREEIHLAPRPDDWNKPWNQQRMRVLDVRVVQEGYVLYHAELDDHAAGPTAGPREDPDNLEPPIPPSGPACDAEAPKRIHLQVEVPESDVRISYQQFTWNPPLPEGTFVQRPPPGMRVEPVTCTDEAASR
jgi:hypothetical protein